MLELSLGDLRPRDAMRPLAPDRRTLATALTLCAIGSSHHLWPFIWIALIPWLSSLDACESYGEALAQGIWCGLAFTTGLFSWAAGSTLNQLSVPSAAIPLAIVVATPLLQPHFLLWPLVRRALRSLNSRKPESMSVLTLIASSLSYAALEALMPRIFKDGLGHAFVDSRVFTQAADLGGVTLLTFLACLVNEALHQAWCVRKQGMPRVRTPLALAVAVVIATAGYGLVRLKSLAIKEGRSATKIQALLVQGGHDETPQVALDHYIGLSAEAERRGVQPDLIIWPETAYPGAFLFPKSLTDQAQAQRLEYWIDRQPGALLFGTTDDGEGPTYNVMLAESPQRHQNDGSPWIGIYRKVHLFPIGETLPPFMASPAILRRLHTLELLQAADEPTLLAVPTRMGEIQVGPMICYESVFPEHAIDEVRKGAQILVDITNDSWADGTPAQELHFRVARLHAVETRTPLLHASSTGVTAIVTPEGDVQARLEAGRPGVLDAQVTIAAKPHWTLMKAWGDWFGSAALVASLALTAVLALMRASAMRRTAPCFDPQSLNETAAAGSVKMGEDSL